jgi:hypothetical protein
MTDQSQEHSVRSPSSSHRWRRCAGSINAEKGYADRVGIEAAEGTIFHEHAELALRLDLPPTSFKTGLLQTVSGHTVCYNDEMAEAMVEGLAYIWRRMFEYRDEFGEEPILMVEQRVWIEPWTLEKGGFGTSDVCIIFPRWKLIIVFDWKYGKIAVSAKENDQLWLYCLGCWVSFASKHFNDDPEGVLVELTINQPRVPGQGGTWHTTMVDVLAEGEKIKIDAAATYNPDAVRTPGLKQCVYCKAQANCKELAAYNLEQFSVRFEEIDDELEYDLPVIEPQFEEWTDARKAWVLLHKKVFDRWFKKLHDEAIMKSARGEPFPYMKMVLGKKGHRAYINEQHEADVARVLIAEVGEKKAFQKKLVTPAAAQDLLGKKKYEALIKEHVYQPPGKPIMVPDTDPRKAEKTLGQEFDMLLDDDDNNDGED